MKKPLVLIGLVLTVACGGGGSSSTPSTTPPTTQPPVTTPPTTLNPLVAECGDPTPPPLVGLKMKIHIDNGFKKQLDTKPLVANVNDYCNKAGIGGGKFCETRPEGSPQRGACDGLVVGRAADTGRLGPTWTWNGKPCFAVGASGGAPGCENMPDNQFLVLARGPGSYMACAAESWPLAEDGSRCVILEIP